MLYPLKKLAFLVMACPMLGLMLAGGVSAQPPQTKQPESLQSNKTGNLALVNRGPNALPVRPATQTTSLAGARLETEPLLLLLFGLVVFIGATTMKHRRSAAESTPEGETN